MFFDVHLLKWGPPRPILCDVQWNLKPQPSLHAHTQKERAREREKKLTKEFLWYRSLIRSLLYQRHDEVASLLKVHGEITPLLKTHH